MCLKGYQCREAACQAWIAHFSVGRSLMIYQSSHFPDKRQGGWLPEAACQVYARLALRGFDLLQQFRQLLGGFRTTH